MSFALNRLACGVRTFVPVARAAPKLQQPVFKAVLSTFAKSFAPVAPRFNPVIAAGAATAGLSLYAFARSTAYAQAESAASDGGKLEPTLLQKCIAEAIGTGIIVAGGCGIVAASAYAGSGIGLLGISTGFGMSVMLAVFATGHISGAHLNPAVTLSLVVNNGVDSALALPYIAAQTIGATVAGALVYLCFSDGIKAVEKAGSIVRGSGCGASAGVFNGAFGMIPNQALVRVPGAFAVEVAATAALLFMINAITDPDGSVPAGAAPAAIGATVATLIASIGPVTGCGMNPARDLGPRLVSAVVGLRGAALSPGWWVYTAGPICGGILGGALYHAVK